jgi:hypothetical protein
VVPGLAGVLGGPQADPHPHLDLKPTPPRRRHTVAQPEQNDDQVLDDAARLGTLTNAANDQSLPEVVRDVAAAAAERIADRNRS